MGVVGLDKYWLIINDLYLEKSPKKAKLNLIITCSLVMSGCGQAAISG